ncbi:hypothetical protein SKAU_G00199200 [Synaphobranchus kaupii]|uniref:Uncharacterized protein n=1 Tax=Synaphobranchus kaupii TaxID=118154 RepID=A0A9Q1FF75_SYNKA|nr:hypothetical protein SKAU_G00199200 [Synaphobranchus kaupii]
MQMPQQRLVPFFRMTRQSKTLSGAVVTSFSLTSQEIGDRIKTGRRQSKSKQAVYSGAVATFSFSSGARRIRNSCGIIKQRGCLGGRGHGRLVPPLCKYSAKPVRRLRLAGGILGDREREARASERDSESETGGRVQTERENATTGQHVKLPVRDLGWNDQAAGPGTSIRIPLRHRCGGINTNAMRSARPLPPHARASAPGT